MGTINSRSKGIRFERQLCNLLSEKLNRVITRNWQAQTAEGGYDLEGLPNFAIEVKACKDITVNPWWAQTVEQANECGRLPALFYKPSQKPWVVVLDLALIDQSLAGERFSTTIDGFVSFARFKGLV